MCLSQELHGRDEKKRSGGTITQNWNAVIMLVCTRASVSVKVKQWSLTRVADCGRGLGPPPPSPRHQRQTETNDDTNERVTKNGGCDDGNGDSDDE